MLLKLGEDIFGMILIDEVIALHDGFGGGAAVHGLKQFLLVTQGDLGIGDKKGRDQGVRLSAFLAAYALDTEAYGMGKVFDGSEVMTEKDQASLLATGTFNQVKLQAVDKIFI